MDVRTKERIASSAPQSAGALIAHILWRYHAAHRDELPKLHRLALKIEQVRMDHPACPKGLSKFLAELLGELEHHMQREEAVLFPTLLAGGGGCVPFAIRRMRSEHDDQHAQLLRLAWLTDDFCCPQGADDAWQALYAGCLKLHQDLREHIRIENDELFPLFEKLWRQSKAPGLADERGTEPSHDA